MFFVIYGSDQLKQKEEKDALLKKYCQSDDDFNFVEFDGHVDVASLSSAMQQAPMFADYYVILLHVNKKQFIRFIDYLKPAEFTVLILICDDFNYSEELFKDLHVDQTFNCKPLGFKDLVKWIKTKAADYGFSLEIDDRKKLALMFQNSKELSDVLFQMSLLNDFERREFFNDLFKTKQEFVWNLFISLVNGEKKQFFQQYSEQFRVNVELTKSQFNMKIVGGLLFCLKMWQDSPEWILSKLKILEDNGEVLLPFLHSHLIETLVIARKEQSNIPILMRFVSIMQQVKKL